MYRETHRQRQMYRETETDVPRDTQTETDVPRDRQTETDVPRYRLVPALTFCFFSIKEQCLYESVTFLFHFKGTNRIIIRNILNENVLGVERSETLDCF